MDERMVGWMDAAGVMTGPSGRSGWRYLWVEAGHSVCLALTVALNSKLHSRPHALWMV